MVVLLVLVVRVVYGVVLVLVVLVEVSPSHFLGHTLLMDVAMKHDLQGLHSNS